MDHHEGSRSRSLLLSDISTAFDVIEHQLLCDCKSNSPSDCERWVCERELSYDLFTARAADNNPSWVRECERKAYAYELLSHRDCLRHPHVRQAFRQRVDLDKNSQRYNDEFLGILFMLQLCPKPFITGSRVHGSGSDATNSVVQRPDGDPTARDTIVRRPDNNDPPTRDTIVQRPARDTIVRRPDNNDPPARDTIVQRPDNDPTARDTIVRRPDNNDPHARDTIVQRPDSDPPARDTIAQQRPDNDPPAVDLESQQPAVAVEKSYYTELLAPCSGMATSTCGIIYTITSRNLQSTAAKFAMISSKLLLIMGAFLFFTGIAVLCFKSKGVHARIARWAVYAGTVLVALSFFEILGLMLVLL